MADYKTKLKDPRWQKKRLEILNRDHFKCQICMSTDITLHVHHKIYLKNLNPWEYPSYSFMTVCEECHENIDWNHIKNEVLNFLYSIGLNDGYLSFLINDDDLKKSEPLNYLIEIIDKYKLKVNGKTSKK